MENSTGPHTVVVHVTSPIMKINNLYLQMAIMIVFSDDVYSNFDNLKYFWCKKDMMPLWLAYSKRCTVSRSKFMMLQQRLQLRTLRSNNDVIRHVNKEISQQNRVLVTSNIVGLDVIKCQEAIMPFVNDFIKWIMSINYVFETAVMNFHTLVEPLLYICVCPLYVYE